MIFWLIYAFSDGSRGEKGFERYAHDGYLAQNGAQGKRSWSWEDLRGVQG